MTEAAVDELNGLDRDAFVARVGPLFEGSPWIAAGTWPARPFATVGQLHQALCATMYAAPVDQQIFYQKAGRYHPDTVMHKASFI